MHIETLLVIAIGPGHDVGSAQQGGVGNTGNRATTAPIIHQCRAEDVLTDALDGEPLDFGRLRQAGSLRAKSRKWSVGKANAELVHAVERGMERGQAPEFEGR